MRRFLMSLLLVLLCSSAAFALDTVNEKSTWIITMSFFDETKAPVTPTSFTYRIDDVSSGVQIVGDTVVTPGGSTYQLITTPTQNAMRDTTKAVEVHRVTVTWQYGGTKQGTAEYIYQVKNLPKVN